ncbi:MAG: hypothetical protein WCC10_04455 [Tumebacillaceae bacterium]
MALLKDEATKREAVKGMLMTALGSLDHVSVSEAEAFADWTQRKAEMFKKDKAEESYGRLPKDMAIGDIVNVQFGINVGEELSDLKTDGHFGLIWGQQGRNMIIIPLTKKAQPANNKYAVNLGVIAGLPLLTDASGAARAVDSWTKIDMMRPVSLRRIRRIKGAPGGKVTISNQNVLNKIRQVFLNEYACAGMSAPTTVPAAPMAPTPAEEVAAASPSPGIESPKPGNA